MDWATLGMGLSQRKIGNFFRLGIREIRLTNGNVRGVKGLKGFKKTKTPLEKRRVRRRGCGDVVEKI